jgi:flagellin
MYLCNVIPIIKEDDSMVIQHCIEAMNANGKLNITEKGNEKSTRKLSSGYKINIAADDASGLAISEKMRKQIRGLNQANQNAEDGISMVQTADGALEEIQNMLQRMNELCVKAANGTNSDTDREYIQDEIDQLNTEIDRVAVATKFNETYLLNGDIGKDSIITESDYQEINYYTALNGTKAGQNVTKEDIDNTEGIKIVYIIDEVATTQTGTGTTSTDAKYNWLKNALKTEIVPNAVQELIAAYPNAFQYLNGSSIGIGLKLSNKSEMGDSTLAYVGVGYSYYNDKTMVPDWLSYQLAVNIETLTFDSNNMLEADSRNELEVTIVHEMMHAFMDEALTNGMTGVVDGKLADDRFPKWFIEGMAQTAAGGYYDGNDWVKNGLGITTNSTVADIKKALQNNQIGGTDNVDNYGTGYLACMYLGYLAGGKKVDASSIQSGLDTVLSEIKSGKSLADVVKNLTGYSTITAFQNNFADIAANFVYNLTQYVGNGTGGVVGGLTKTDDILSDSAPTQNLLLFELNTTNETVGNKYPAGYTVFTGGSATNGKGDIDVDTNIDTIAASTRAKRGLALQIGADGTKANKLVVYIDAVSAKSLGTIRVNVLTENSATNSIARVGLALSKVSEQRAELGSYQNRLEHTINNLGNVVENTTASESQIRDTDMATEMVKYSNSNILKQAGQAMLAQANQTNQGVLSLFE